MTPKEYAILCHQLVNHKYDGYPYSHHLQMVVNTAMKYQYLLPDYIRETVFDACWAHDILEDTQETYHNLKEATNTAVADIVYACTTEKGRNRAERANDKYYQGIRETPYATFVKLCDRIANVTYSKQQGSGMFEKYKKENGHFKQQLWDKEYAEMFDELTRLFYEPDNN